ncbi:hypothetical protein ACJX0J_009629, partial [Zea mays]
MTLFTFLICLKRLPTRAHGYHLKIGFQLKIIADITCILKKTIFDILAIIQKNMGTFFSYLVGLAFLFLQLVDHQGNVGHAGAAVSFRMHLEMQIPREQITTSILSGPSDQSTYGSGTIATTALFGLGRVYRLQFTCCFINMILCSDASKGRIEQLQELMFSENS